MTIYVDDGEKVKIYPVKVEVAKAVMTLLEMDDELTWGMTNSGYGVTIAEKDEKQRICGDCKHCICNSMAHIDTCELDGSHISFWQADVCSKFEPEEWCKQTTDEAFKKLYATTCNNIMSITPKKNGWIPVNEMLPKEGKTVIASTKYGVYPEAKYTKEYGWLWAYEAGADYWVELENVTAWMPLPTKYEPQESEGQ